MKRSLAETLSATLLRGASAFHRSQIGTNMSPSGASAPVSPAVRNSSKISAWLPRWDATCASDHSSAYDRSIVCSSVSPPTIAVIRSCERRSAASQVGKSAIGVLAGRWDLGDSLDHQRAILG
jgi:hypothetical protein